MVTVLDDYLADKQYLVCDKLTVADLSFVTWDLLLDRILGDSEGIKGVKKREHFQRWHTNVIAHPVVQKMSALREEISRSL